MGLLEVNGSTRWLFVSLYTPDVLHFSRQPLSCRANGRIHHLCNQARAQREVAAWILITSVATRPGGKRAATAHVTHREANTRDGKHHMCRVKSLGVALRVVSGIVNHRGAQALQLLPGGGDWGAEPEVTCIQLVATSSATSYQLPLCPTFNLLRHTPPLPCLLPFPWLKLHCGVSVVTYRTSILPETLTGSWTIAQWLNTPSEFQSQFLLFWCFYSLLRCRNVDRVLNLNYLSFRFFLWDVWILSEWYFHMISCIVGGYPVACDPWEIYFSTLYSEHTLISVTHTIQPVVKWIFIFITEWVSRHTKICKDNRRTCKYSIFLSSSINDDVKYI